MKNINIGITIQLLQEDQTVWSNGIIQNVIFFAETLMNSTNNYNVYIVNIENSNNIKITDKLDWDLNRYKTVQFNDIKNDLDILFILGSRITEDKFRYLHNRNCKVVHYACGNDYIIDMENILFKSGEGIFNYSEYLDETWLIPQMENLNYYYYESLYRKPVRVIPFVWDSYFIDRMLPYLKNKGYLPTNEPKRLSCFEPNVNVFKYSMYDMIIVDRVFRKRPELIKHFYLLNTLHIKDKEMFISLMNRFDIVKIKCATFESRYKTPWFLSEYTDVVIAHQWENALNYAYLDAIYMKYPLVHNAHLCKDCGYYYNGFNVNDGEKQLMYALTEHDKNMDEYNERSKKTLKRYSVTNTRTIEIYDSLIDNLFKPNNDIKLRYYNE